MKLEVLPHPLPCASCGRAGNFRLAGRVQCRFCLRKPAKAVVRRRRAA